MHGTVFGETALDFERPDPLSGHFYEVIGATLEIVKTVAFQKAVAGIDPVSVLRNGGVSLGWLWKGR